MKNKRKTIQMKKNWTGFNQFKCNKKRLEWKWVKQVYLPTNADCALKSPVEFHRLPKPALPLFVFTDCGRGDGDGAGDIELLLGESDWIEPFDWWICFVRLWCNEFTPPLCRLEWMSGVVVPPTERTIGLRSFQSLFALFIPIDEFECAELCEDTKSLKSTKNHYKNKMQNPKLNLILKLTSTEYGRSISWRCIWCTSAALNT